MLTNSDRKYIKKVVSESADKLRKEAGQASSKLKLELKEEIRASHAQFKTETENFKNEAINDILENFCG